MTRFVGVIPGFDADKPDYSLAALLRAVSKVHAVDSLDIVQITNGDETDLTIVNIGPTEDVFYYAPQIIPIPFLVLDANVFAPTQTAIAVTPALRALWRQPTSVSYVDAAVPYGSNSFGTVVNNDGLPGGTVHAYMERWLAMPVWGTHKFSVYRVWDQLDFPIDDSGGPGTETPIPVDNLTWCDRIIYRIEGKAAADWSFVLNVAILPVRISYSGILRDFISLF